MLSDELSFVVGDAELLEQVGPLWYDLIRHHSLISPHFSDFIASRDFDVRRKGLISKTEGESCE